MKLGLILGTALVATAIAAAAIDLQSIPADSAYPVGKQIINSNTTNIEANIDSLTNAVSGYYFTNSLATNTFFTPKRVGDTLIVTPGGSNWLYVSKGLTTNDWVGPFGTR